MSNLSFNKSWYLIFVLWMLSWNSYAEVINGNIKYVISDVHISGVMNVTLHSTQQVNHSFYKIHYDNTRKGKVTLVHKNGVLFIHSEGVFYKSPQVEIFIASKISKYMATGIGESTLYLNTEHLNIQLKDSTKATLIGNASSINFNVSGTSSINIVNYNVKKINGSLDDIASAYVRKNIPININQTDISKIYYHD